MSKGSQARPFDIPRDQYEAQFEGIFGKRERARWVPPPLPDAGANFEQIRRDLREAEQFYVSGKVPPLLPDEEAADVAALEAGFARLEEERKHYLCNGKGWLYAPTGEFCGNCPDCSPEVREANKPQVIKDIEARGAMLMAMTPADLHCKDDLCNICYDDMVGDLK